MTATQLQKVPRESGLELYRIIGMILIVAHHYVVNSGLLELMYQEPLCGKSIFLFLFGMWGKTGINCFVLITGYFMCTSRITLRKFLKLLMMVYFYRIIIYYFWTSSTECVWHYKSSASDNLCRSGFCRVLSFILSNYSLLKYTYWGDE